MLQIIIVILIITSQASTLRPTTLPTMKMSTMPTNVVTKNDSSIKERWVRVEKLVGVKWMENLDGMENLDDME